MESSMLRVLDLDPQFPHHQMQPAMADHDSPPAIGKRKANQQPHLFHNCSDEEEENSAEDLIGKGKKGLPWQRMKWTDEMVRLLISVVASVEDDGAPDSSDGPRRRAAVSGGALQKKGKWKTVSKLMLEKGCCVSPQQCEDKFNDLNKRYKRLNEILGRGTTCQVVENPNLLDSMHHVPPKGKEDVRKILSSKHLFYREMCAYHNGGCAPPQAAALPVGFPAEEDADGGSEEDDEEGDAEEGNGELGRGTESFQAEIDGVIGDSSRSVWERRDWIKKRRLQLEEERMEIQAKGFELEKSRFKWQRFCSKKDRELERMRLENDRMNLENQRMSLQLRQIEAEMEISRAAEPIDSPGFRIVQD